MENFSFLAIAPEVLLTIGAVAVLGVEVVWHKGHRAWAPIAAVSVLGAIIASVAQWNHVQEVGGSLHYSLENPAGQILTPMLSMDGFSAFGGIAIFVVTGLALAAAWDLVARLHTRGAELVSLILLAAIGLHLMAASANLVMLFLGLEVASISLYVVAGFTRHRVTSDESAMKYFLLGSFASAILLYGIALVFAATGSTSIYGATGIAATLDTVLLRSDGVLLAGMALIIVGLGFKISAAPFHQWAPDVYQGAPTGVVGFMAAGVKIAGFAAMARVLSVALGTQSDDWAPAIAVLAVASVLIGSVMAIAQSDIKRMLAYSGVAHAGFMLTAIVAGLEGIPSLWFYLATYAIQLVGAFAVVGVVGGSAAGGSAIDDYAGLGERSPKLAVALTIFMLAMGGIPLTSGFIGKAGVFSAAISADYLWLAVVALVGAVVGLYFYLRIIVVMYMRSPAEAPGTAIAAPAATQMSSLVIWVAAVATIALGIAPWPLLHVVRDALPF